MISPEKELDCKERGTFLQGSFFYFGGGVRVVGVRVDGTFLGRG